MSTNTSGLCESSLAQLVLQWSDKLDVVGVDTVSPEAEMVRLKAVRDFDAEQVENDPVGHQGAARTTALPDGTVTVFRRGTCPVPAITGCVNLVPEAFG